jgi:hypothetical protein
MNYEEPKVGVLQAVEVLETAFEACEHPYAAKIPELDWCNVCGARAILNAERQRVWCSPHWRDILVPALCSMEKT